MRTMPSKRFRFRISASRARHLLPMGMAIIVASAFATTADAQQYRSEKVDAQARRYGGVALQAVRNPAGYAANKAKVEEYFKNYYFPDMTQNGPDALAGLGDARYNLFRRYLWATDNAQFQQDLTQWAFNAARAMAGASDPPYHPAVRYNAVLILGQLDKRYAVQAGPNLRPPEPLPEATELLTKIVSAAEDSRIPPSVTLAAVIGLERHAQYREALAPGAAEAMTTALRRLVGHEKPIHDMDRQSFDWLRLRAAGVLAQLGSVGPNNEVHNQLLELVAEFRSLDDRTAAAALLAKLNYEGAKVDGAASVERLFALSRDLGAAEAKRAEDYQNARTGGGGGFGFGSARGGESFMPSGERETFPRRQVLARLVDLRAGLRAVKPLVSEDVQAQIDAVIKAIQPVITAAADKDTVELKLAASIHTMAAAIDREAAAPEKPAEETEVEAAT